MKKIIILFVFLFLFVNITAIDFEKVKKHVERTPVFKTKDIRKLSEYLTYAFANQDEQFAAIYFWVAKNIDYDVKQQYSAPSYLSVDEIIRNVMKKRKGVCQHYAELFHELARLSGLVSYVISGYGKEYGKIMHQSHVWNVIKIKEKWYFVDATWGAGSINSHNKYQAKFSLEYFMVKPERFIQKHMPFDPMWQLLKRPLYYEEFEHGIDTNSKRDEFNYKDTIAVYLKLSEIDQLKSSIRRIKTNGERNDLVRFELKFEKSKLKVLEDNEQVKLINTANTYYNNAVSALNEFNSLKRRKTHDRGISLYQLKRELNKMEQELNKSKSIYYQLKTTNPQLSASLSKAKLNVKKFERIIEQQRNWLSGISE